mmetsp:Transcript_5574/g.14150  ORF Transcript_5574/g.14150 Transcript_5574/m.14150 type:complete len:253 (-) Transcript_5574:164-922(-)
MAHCAGSSRLTLTHPSPATGAALSRLVWAYKPRSQAPQRRRDLPAAHQALRRGPGVVGGGEVGDGPGPLRVQHKAVVRARGLLLAAVRADLGALLAAAARALRGVRRPQAAPLIPADAHVRGAPVGGRVPAVGRPTALGAGCWWGRRAGLVLFPAEIEQRSPAIQVERGPVVRSRGRLGGVEGAQRLQVALVRDESRPLLAAAQPLDAAVLPLAGAVVALLRRSRGPAALPGPGLRRQLLLVPVPPVRRDAG